MIITTHNVKDIDGCGTSLQGVLSGISYQRLVDLFGVPTVGYDYKTDAEWYLEIRLQSGEIKVATIYNWKNGKNYLGQGAPSTDQITEWNIGAHDIATAKIVEKIVKGF